MLGTLKVLMNVGHCYMSVPMIDYDSLECHAGFWDQICAQQPRVPWLICSAYYGHGLRLRWYIPSILYEKRNSSFFPGINNSFGSLPFSLPTDCVSRWLDHHGGDVLNSLVISLGWKASRSGIIMGFQLSHTINLILLCITLLENLKP